MNITATIDTSALTAKNAEMLAFAEQESIKTVAATHKRLILGYTAQGADAMGEIFHGYSKGWAKVRAMQGYSTTTKDLSMDQGRLYKMELEEDTLTYTDEETMKIASGQMHHPKWSYHHNFFNASQSSDDIAGLELEDLLRGKL